MRLAADGRFDDGDEVIETHRTAAADIDHAIGRSLPVATGRVLGEPDHGLDHVARHR